MNLKRTPRWVLVALGLMLLPAGLAAQVAGGQAQVIDGRTLVIKGKRFMLHGIDVPDLAQSCTLRGRPVRCGLLSRWALMDLV
ncbi:MAG: thermonuclease family protein, partial [Alphaproteobacteria bacterium]